MAKLPPPPWRRYIFAKDLNEDLVGLYHVDYHNQLWVRIVVRKEHHCELCGERHRRGDFMWRPITNAQNRWRRICLTCMGKLKDIARLNEEAGDGQE